MAWIGTVDEPEAEGQLSDMYSALLKSRGKVSNIMKAQSLNPEAMKAHLDLYMSLMFSRSGLSRAERELIATRVSVLNLCDYCKSHHGAALNKYWKDAARVKSLMKGHEGGGLFGRERAMLGYAEKRTQKPGSVSQEDSELLRKEGFFDSEILNMTMIVGYFNFVNRIALGLGVDFDPEKLEGYRA